MAVLLRYPTLTLTSIKARDVRLRYKRLLKIGILSLDQDRTMFIVSKFEFAQCIGSRAVKLKTITMRISAEWYGIFVSYNCKNRIIYMSICEKCPKCIPMQASMKNGVLSDSFQC